MPRPRLPRPRLPRPRLPHRQPRRQSDNAPSPQPSTSESSLPEPSNSDQIAAPAAPQVPEAPSAPQDPEPPQDSSVSRFQKRRITSISWWTSLSPTINFTASFNYQGYPPPAWSDPAYTPPAEPQEFIPLMTHHILLIVPIKLDLFFILEKKNFNTSEL